MTYQSDHRHFLPIRIKVFLGFMVIAMLTEALVYAGVFSVYRQNEKTQYYQQTEQALELMLTEIRSNLAELEQGIVYKIQVSKALQTDYALFQDDQYMFQRNLQKLSSMLQMARVPLRSIYCEESSGQIAYYGRTGAFKGNLAEYRESEIYEYLQENRETFLNHSGGTWFRRFSDNPDEIYMIKNVIDSNSADYLGIMVLEMDQSYLQSMYESVESAYECSVAIYTEGGELLSCGNDFLEAAEEYNPLTDTGNEKGWNSYLVTRSDMPRSKWIVVAFKSESELTAGLMEMVPRLAMVGVLILIFAFVLAQWFAKTQTENIDAMVRQIRSITGAKSDALTKIDIRSDDEMVYLEDAFNELIERLNQSVQRMAYASVEKDKAEYNALMAQTDPHFLYNTLEGISSIARLHGDQEIVDCINRLSRLYRVAVHGKGEEIPLREEMSYVESYLELEHMITGGRINIVVDPDPETLDLMVPKLIIQPIVENSIRHGVEDMTEGGTVIVTSRVEDDKLEISVADNGKGITQDRIQKLLSTEEKDAMHIGVSSVQRRIRILYGAKYGLNIRSDHEGTVVSIWLPVQMSKGQNDDAEAAGSFA